MTDQMPHLDVQQVEPALPLLQRVLAEEGANPYHRCVMEIGVQP